MKWNLSFWKKNLLCGSVYSGVLTNLLHCIIISETWLQLHSLPHCWHPPTLSWKPSDYTNFNSFLLASKCWQILMAIRQKKIFLIKKSKWSTQKICFFNFMNSQYFFAKISGIGPWICKRNWCEGHECGSLYGVVRLSDVRS